MIHYLRTVFRPLFPSLTLILSTRFINVALYNLFSSTSDLLQEKRHALQPFLLYNLLWHYPPLVWLGYVFPFIRGETSNNLLLYPFCDSLREMYGSKRAAQNKISAGNTNTRFSKEHVNGNTISSIFLLPCITRIYSLPHPSGTDSIKKL